MRKPLLALVCSLALLAGGCARWEPQQASPVKLVRACPLKRAPRVDDFPHGGLRAAYHFVTQGAPESDLKALLRSTAEHGFGLIPMTISINGKDTLFAQGPGVLTDQEQVDAEFELACSLGHGRAYLTHVRYNPVEQEGGPVRAR